MEGEMDESDFVLCLEDGTCINSWSQVNAGDKIEILKKRPQSKRKETRTKTKTKKFIGQKISEAARPERYFESNSTAEEQEPYRMTKMKCVSFDLTIDPSEVVQSPLPSGRTTKRKREAKFESKMKTDISGVAPELD